MHRAASRTPPGWTARPGSAPPEPALGWEDARLPPGWGACPCFTPQLRSLQFRATPPLPGVCASPALPSPRIGAGWPPSGGPGRGPPYPRPSRLGELGSPTRPPLHSTAGTGAAEPGSSCLLFRVGWQRPGGPVGRVRVGEPRVGPASSGRPPFSGVPAPSEREPSALGEAGHSWRSPGQQVFCLQPEVGPMALQGSRPPELPRNPGRFQSVPRSRASVPPAASSL